MTGVSYFLLALAAVLLAGCGDKSRPPRSYDARALFDGNLVRRSIENERRLRGEQYRDPGDHEAPSHGCRAPETMIGSTAKIFRPPQPVYRRRGHVATLAFRSRLRLSTKPDVLPLLRKVVAVP
jgi:hypothetical protein